jgi:hypothetical protein
MMIGFIERVLTPKPKMWTMTGKGQATAIGFT